MKRTNAILIAAVCFLVMACKTFGGLGISPSVVGNGAGDSIYITISSIDTTYYPEVSDLDSLDILRYTPGGVLLDSTSENASNVLNPSKGFYRAVFRASDGSGTKGVYTVLVRGWRGGKERGVASGAYEVVGKQHDAFQALVDSLRDSVYAILDTLQDGFQSHTSSADTGAIARSVWDDDVVALADRRIRYADSVGTVLSVPSSGSGAYACSLYYFNAADSSAIQGVYARVMNSSQTATSAIGITDSDGLVVMSLDDALYHVWSYRVGYIFSPLPDSVVVSAPSIVDSIWATYFDPGSPSSPSLCRVYGWVRDLSGDGITGATVAANVRQSPLRYGSMIISPYFESTVTDTSGYWYLDLIPSGDLDPSTTSYTFSIYYKNGAIAVKSATVPDSTSWVLDW
ncbi:MAG: hypothetical protein ABIK83_14620 [Candidatus Zixiibacteriota bacterium]